MVLGPWISLQAHNGPWGHFGIPENGNLSLLIKLDSSGFSILEPDFPVTEDEKRQEKHFQKLETKWWYFSGPTTTYSGLEKSDENPPPGDEKNLTKVGISPIDFLDDN